MERNVIICDFRHFWGLSETSPILIFKYATEGAHAQSIKYIPRSDAVLETPITSRIQSCTSLMAPLINTCSIYLSKTRFSVSSMTVKSALLLLLLGIIFVITQEESHFNGCHLDFVLVLATIFAQMKRVVLFFSCIHSFLSFFICSSELMWSPKLQVGKAFVITMASSPCVQIYTDWKYK